MKQVILSIVAIAMSFASFAQMTEGSIKFSIDIESDDPQMEMMKPMLAGSTLEMLFAEGKSKTIMKLGSVMTMTTIVDTESTETTVLAEGMMGKKGATGSLDNVPEPEENDDEPTVELIDETKEILGYACKKAVITDSEGTELIYWYTDEIEIDRKGQNVLTDKIPGVPLEFAIDNEQFVMVMTATEVNKKLPAKEKVVFSMDIPEGYEEVSMEDMMKGQG